MKFIFLLCLCAGILLHTQGQNNPIFNGGISDGVDRASFLQAGNNIYNGGSADGVSTSSFSQSFTNIFNGGNGDGWSSNNFMQAGNNIFNGGNSDGWSTTNFMQAGNNIFNGGDGDGWSFTSFAQAVNNIYNGGNADGWSFTNFAQAGNNIFNGGEGDGWASTYRPLGPLPITIISFEAAKQNTKVELDWVVANAVNFSRFEVERSNNAVSFVKIGTVNGASASSYNFIDAFPSTGNNYYRLKLIDIDGKFIYTPVRVVNFGSTEDFISIYPNPVLTQTKIVLTANMMSQPMVLNVINSLGQIVIQQKIGTNSQAMIQLDCSRLPAGTYVVHLRGNTINVSSRLVKQ